MTEAIKNAEVLAKNLGNHIKVMDVPYSECGGCLAGKVTTAEHRLVEAAGKTLSRNEIAPS